LSPASEVLPLSMRGKPCGTLHFRDLLERRR
jgi:hypothetical protein